MILGCCQNVSCEFLEALREHYESLTLVNALELRARSAQGGASPSLWLEGEAHLEA